MRSMTTAGRARGVLHRSGPTCGLASLALLATWAGAAATETPEARRLAYQCSVLTKEPAIAACRQALDLGLSPGRAATVHTLLALHLAGLHRWDEVVASYRELVRLRPADALAHWRLGDALLFGLHKSQESLAPLREAVRLDPDLVGAHVSLGVALAELDDRAGAVEAFEEAQRLDPRCFESRPGARSVFDAARRPKP